MDDALLAREIGRRLRQARVSVYGERSQSHLARLMKTVTQSDISRWEAGSRIPDVVQFVRFSEACGAPPTRLLRGLGSKITMEQQPLPLGAIDSSAAQLVRRLVLLLRERSVRPSQPRRRAS
ncbi:MAG: helix-turn-helix transcriptional regulator [Chloroflexi bacterium]|nr:helix-turn-helix transcriptional regulator [Chloroflexota bacterium]